MGKVGAVYEATQVSLGRRVALRLIPAEQFASAEDLIGFDRRQALAASVGHPALVPIFEVGGWEGGGRFVASRLIRGRSLVTLRAEGNLPAAGSLAPLAAALGAAHAVGLSHGGVSAENVLLDGDGTPYLADLGLVDGGDAETDFRALASLASMLPAQPRQPARRRVSLRAVAAAAFAASVITAAVAVNARDSGAGAEEIPQPVPGTTVLGSGLGAPDAESFGCVAEPSPNTPACTIAQTQLGGRTLRIRRSGVIRGWALRGAMGDVSLQVIRRRDGGKFFVAGFTQPESLTSTSPQRLPADIGVRPGDVVGLRLGPGAVVGLAPQGPGAVTRWDGALEPDSRASSGEETPGELMLRIEIDPGAQPAGPRQLLGERALDARAGSELASTPISLGSNRLARAVVVELPSGIAIDVIADGRLARIAVPDLDPDGEVDALTQHCGGSRARGFCLLWRNPGEGPVTSHAYTVERDGRINLIG